MAAGSRRGAALASPILPAPLCTVQRHPLGHCHIPRPLQSEIIAGPFRRRPSPVEAIHRGPCLPNNKSYWPACLSLARLLPTSSPFPLVALGPAAVHSIHSHAAQPSIAWPIFSALKFGHPPACAVSAHGPYKSELVVLSSHLTLSPPASFLCPCIPGHQKGLSSPRPCLANFAHPCDRPPNWTFASSPAASMSTPQSVALAGRPANCFATAGCCLSPPPLLGLPCCCCRPCPWPWGVARPRRLPRVSTQPTSQ